MSQVLGVIRRAPKELVSYEAFVGLDDQGMPQYASEVQIEAHVREYSGQSNRSFVIENDGSRVEVPLSMWIEGDAPVIPAERGRITLDDHRSFIVMQVKPVSRLRYSRGFPSHVRVRCRKE